MSYVRTLAGVAVFLVLSIAGVTAWLDPYADLYFLTGIGSGPPPSTNNYGERKYKARLIRELAPGSVRYFVFGNSRATAIDIGAGLPGRPGTGVNMGFGGATLGQIQAFMTTARGLHPEALSLLAIDFAQCLHPPAGDDRLYLGPLGDLPSRYDALQRLISLRTFWFAIRVTGNPRAYSEVALAKFGNLVRHLDYADRARIDPRIAADVEAYRRLFGQASYTDRCVEQVRGIRRAFPDTVVFVNPLSRSMADVVRETGHADGRRAWIEALREDGPVIDFNCSAQITGRPGNYSDAHHYSRAVGAIMLGDIGRFLAGEKPEYGCLK